MQLKHTVLALAAAGVLSAQAHASEAQVEAAVLPSQTVTTFSEADLTALFESSDKPMQLAALSEVEMKETEGAFWGNALGAFAGGLSSTYGYFASVPRYQQTGWGALTAFGGGAFAGALNPVRGFGSLAGTLAGGFGGSYISNWRW